MKTLFSRLFRTRSQSRRRAARPGRRTAPLAVEVLDQRVLPSVTPALVNGQLQLVGDAGNDRAFVSANTRIQFVGFVAKLISPVQVDASFADGTSTKNFDGSSLQ